MNKEKLIITIKAWLQKFADRDNETFHVQLNKWRISMQYDYDLDGYRVDPYNWCSRGFKHVHDNTLEDRTEEELSAILEELLNKKQHH